MTTKRLPAKSLLVTYLFSIIFVLGFSQKISAAHTFQDLEHIGQRWDEITYHWPKKQRMAGLTELLSDIQNLKQSNPEKPELLVWEAIVLVSRASLNPGLGILGELKYTRNLLLHAIELDPEIMDGAAYLALGCLYYKVPGWPLSFGNSEKAAHYFHKALALNPKGIESNYYYADYLRKIGKAQQSFRYYQKVADLPLDPAQPYLSQRLKEKARHKLTKLVAQVSTIVIKSMEKPDYSGAEPQR